LQGLDASSGGALVIGVRVRPTGVQLGFAQGFFLPLRDAAKKVRNGLGLFA